MYTILNYSSRLYIIQCKLKGYTGIVDFRKESIEFLEINLQKKEKAGTFPKALS